MKKLIPFMALLVGVTGALAQGVGTVDFNNNRTYATVADRLVRDLAGSPLVGTNFMAQLYFGADAASLQAVTSNPARFRVATTTQPGTWSGGTRTLTGFTAGQTVTLQVRAWDAGPNGTLTYDQASLRNASATFTYTVPAAGAPANAFFIENFRGFVIPEPSVIGLGLLGAGALFLLRRRKA